VEATRLVQQVQQHLPEMLPPNLMQNLPVFDPLLPGTVSPDDWLLDHTVCMQGGAQLSLGKA
jgi:hypothetical protein